MKNRNITPKLKEKYLKYIFNDFTDDKQYKMDEVSIYSVTPQEYADRISELIFQYMKTNNIVITDMMACIGGNSISFCKKFKRVNIIELSEERYDFLKYNLKLCRLTNYNLYNFDCLNKVIELRQDIIFIDPEWGGRGYKFKKNLDLYISNIPLYSVCNRLMKYCKLQVLKLPNNFNIKKFKGHSRCKIVKIYDMNKFQLIFLEE